MADWTANQCFGKALNFLKRGISTFEKSVAAAADVEDGFGEEDVLDGELVSSLLEGVGRLKELADQQQARELLRLRKAKLRWELQEQNLRDEVEKLKMAATQLETENEDLKAVVQAKEKENDELEEENLVLVDFRDGVLQQGEATKKKRKK